MDNLTHSLIGALVGETAARLIPAGKSRLPPATRRNLFVTLMVVGSNLPDLDILFSDFTDGKLGYLLQHRGHTHTVIGALAGAVLMLAAILAWMRWQRVPSTPADRHCLTWLALFAPLLHIAMDAANSYGVHPFWPFNNHWLYGDSIFIVEPLFWATGAPLVFLLQSRFARTVVALILLVGILLSFGTGLVPRPLAVGLTVMTATLLLVAWRTSQRTAALSGLCAAVVVFSMFVLAGHLAYRQVTALATAQFPQARLLDSVMTPMPVNPLCWETILVQLEQDQYSLRRAIFSLAPAVIPAAQCPSLTMQTPTTAPLVPVVAENTASLHWYGEYVMSRAELQRVTAGNCEALAFSRFARALFVTRRESQWLIGDLRFDREPGLGLAELALTDNPASCPQHVPPWIPPRSDVLEPP
jgi:inner membrane protein